MYKNKSVCVVVPCYNEELLIGRVIETMPDFIDKILIVDDVSKDRTVEIVKSYQEKTDRIALIEHKKNQGVGGSISTGYKWVRDNDFDIAVVMAGDAQMDPADLPAILDPVAENKADYSKGNRLFTGEVFYKIPKLRYLGNSALSLLTKIASGYWHIADSQSGYTAINKEALRAINWDRMYKRYGQPNDLLVTLNVHNFRVHDVHVKPIYYIGEKSGIKVKKVIFTISWLLIKRFIWRLKEKYVIRDFHPLVFFYFLGFLFGIMTAFLSVRLCYFWYLRGQIPDINALAAMFSFMSFALFTVFAMWFDMESNKELK